MAAGHVDGVAFAAPEHEELPLELVQEHLASQGPGHLVLGAGLQHDSPVVGDAVGDLERAPEDLLYIQELLQICVEIVGVAPYLEAHAPRDRPQSDLVQVREPHPLLLHLVDLLELPPLFEDLGEEVIVRLAEPLWPRLLADHHLENDGLVPGYLQFHAGQQLPQGFVLGHRLVEVIVQHRLELVPLVIVEATAQDLVHPLDVLGYRRVVEQLLGGDQHRELPASVEVLLQLLLGLLVPDSQRPRLIGAGEPSLEEGLRHAIIITEEFHESLGEVASETVTEYGVAAE